MFKSFFRFALGFLLIVAFGLGMLVFTPYLAPIKAAVFSAFSTQ